jgi:hypothetical protein
MIKGADMRLFLFMSFPPRVDQSPNGHILWLHHHPNLAVSSKDDGTILAASGKTQRTPNE